MRVGHTCPCYVNHSLPRIFWALNCFLTGAPKAHSPCSRFSSFVQLNCHSPSRPLTICIERSPVWNPHGVSGAQPGLPGGSAPDHSMGAPAVFPRRKRRALQKGARMSLGSRWSSRRKLRPRWRMALTPCPLNLREMQPPREKRPQKKKMGTSLRPR